MRKRQTAPAFDSPGRRGVVPRPSRRQLGLWNSQQQPIVRTASSLESRSGSIRRAGGRSRRTGFGRRFGPGGEDAGFARELLEEALGHQIGTVVERAYRRTDGFERRRAVVQAWADVCFGEPAAAKV